MFVRSSYLHNGISYTGKTSLYWIIALVSMHQMSFRARSCSLPSNWPLNVTQHRWWDPLSPGEGDPHYLGYNYINTSNEAWYDQETIRSQPTQSLWRGDADIITIWMMPGAGYWHWCQATNRAGHPVGHLGENKINIVLYLDKSQQCHLKIIKYGFYSVVKSVNQSGLYWQKSGFKIHISIWYYQYVNRNLALKFIYLFGITNTS